MSFGTDWGSLAAAWLTHWERTGSEKARKKLEQSMKSIAAQPQGFFSGGAMMDMETGIFEISENPRATASHLSAVFGLMEICTELVELTDIPEFDNAWLQYCEFYSASPGEQKEEFGNAMNNRSLRQGHSRLTAYAAMKQDDPELARRAWNEFTYHKRQWSLAIPPTQKINPPEVLNPVLEAPFISTNYAAQWGLAAMQIMQLLGEEVLKMSNDQ